MNTDEPVMGFESVTQALGWLPLALIAGIALFVAFASYMCWPNFRAALS
jgi:hypothetical protein